MGDRFHPQDREPERFLLWEDLQPITRGLSRTTVWRMQQRGEFPSPIRISPGRVGWVRDEIRRWQIAKAERIDQAAPPGSKRRGRPRKTLATQTPIEMPEDTPEETRPGDSTRASDPGASDAADAHSIGAPSATPDPPVAADAEAPRRRTRKRKPPVAPGQISFDF